MLAGGGGPSGMLASPSFVQQNTAYTNDMGADGYNWSQGGPRGPIGVDTFGKLFALCQNNSASHTIVYSNDSGATWSDSVALPALARGSLAYNSADDRLEVCWSGSAASDGVLFRRYSITRDGSNNITAFTALGAGYCQLDAETTGTMQYEHPCILWLSDAAYGAHGAVLCLWSARNTGVGGTGNEIRAAMRVISGTIANDQNPANWTHIGVSSTTTIGNAPGTASYTAVVANTTASVPYGSLGRLANGDLFLAYSDGANTNLWRFRRATFDGTSAWTSLGTVTTITAIKRAGTDSGYTLKQQLGTKIVQDASGNVYFGIATWKDDTNGDTWGYAQITSGDTVTLVDSYSSAGAHSYAPTGDIDYDSASGRLVVSYIKTTTQAGYIKSYTGLTAAQGETLMFSSAPIDIPLIRTRVITGKLGILFRDTNTPHLGWFGTMAWS